MAKFYVQSGTLRNVIDSNDHGSAALWAVHKVMQQIAPIYDDRKLTPAQKNCSAACTGLLVLDDKISVSEQGFDREDACFVDTFEAVTQWNQLMVALDRLEQLL